jgi:serine/threonine-protein kinase
MTQLEPPPTIEDPQLKRARERLGMLLQEKWTLDALLGVGGMAAVYAATHRNGKRVAVKMLHAEMGRLEEVQRRFLQEGYAANTIQHDGAVSVLDDDVAPDGSPFIVMELLEGEPLDRWLERSGTIPPRDVLAIADQLLDVLSAAHAKNVVHRDIKPENLFVTKNGMLKVLDFGIARVFEARAASSTSTQMGIVMGTPAFMAPEQARARWDEVDGRTDLWAVGATMFTLLTARHVHVSDSGNEQLIQSATTPAPPIASIAADVPPEVAAIVDRALAFEREKRWPNALAMQEAIRHAQAILGPPDTVVSSGMRPRMPSMLGQAQGQGPGPAAGGANTVLEGSAGASRVTAWAKEREARAVEAAKLKTTISELQQKHATAKKRVAEAESSVEAGRVERAQLERWFQRQVGTRTAAVEEARKAVRERAIAVARQALVDREAFGTEHDASRETIATLERASQSAARDVTVHQMALGVYDSQGMRLGTILLAVAVALALVLLIAPIVWRATRVVEPPIQSIPPTQPLPLPHRK